MASVTVDVEIDEFGDDEILKAAVPIVRRLLAKPDDLHKWEAEPLDQLRKLFTAPLDYTPKSTAATLVHAFQVRELVESSNGFYRFAGEGQ